MEGLISLASSAARDSPFKPFRVSESLAFGLIYPYTSVVDTEFFLIRNKKLSIKPIYRLTGFIWDHNRATPASLEAEFMFVLTSAPTVFQALINDVPNDMPNQFLCLLWWHSIFFREQGGTCLMCRNMSSKFHPCNFLVSFLSRGSYQSDSARIQEWPTPSNWRLLLQFLDFSNFY